MFDHPLVEGGRDDTRYYNDSGVKGLLGKYAASHSILSEEREYRRLQMQRQSKSIILLMNIIIINNYIKYQNKNMYYIFVIEVTRLGSPGLVVKDFSHYWTFKP